MGIQRIKIWHPIAGFIITLIADFINDTYLFHFPGPIWEILEIIIPILYIIWIALLGYVIIGAIKSRMGHQSPETSTYADEKEKELLRKQNEILVHLIQDEHREEGR